MGGVEARVVSAKGPMPFSPTSSLVRTRPKDTDRKLLVPPSPGRGVHPVGGRRGARGVVFVEPSYPANSCVFPFNSAHERYLMNAALLRLNQWIDGGTLPPTAPPIDVVSGAIQRVTHSA